MTIGRGKSKKKRGKKKKGGKRGGRPDERPFLWLAPPVPGPKKEKRRPEKDRKGGYNSKGKGAGDTRPKREEKGNRIKTFFSIRSGIGGREKKKKGGRGKVFPGHWGRSVAREKKPEKRREKGKGGMPSSSLPTPFTSKEGKLKRGKKEECFADSLFLEGKNKRRKWRERKKPAGPAEPF